MLSIPDTMMPHVKRFGLSGVAAVALVVVMLFGINPVTVLTGQTSPPPPPNSLTAVPPVGAPLAALAAYPPVVGGEAELMWRRAFRISALWYPPISMRTVDDPSQFGCGMAGRDLTVFYCPDDMTVNVDLAAYARLRDGFPAGADRAIAYLVAESYGHHVQNALEALQPVREARGRGTPEVAASLEQQLDMQAACYAGMWASTAGIGPLYDDPEVVAALAQVAAERQRAILDPGSDNVIPETFTAASFAARKSWYDAGYAIPAGGNCSLERIAARGLS